MTRLFKLNFDGASRGNPSISRARVCIRDLRGTIKATRIVGFPSGTNNMEEVLDIFYGL